MGKCSARLAAYTTPPPQKVTSRHVILKHTKQDDMYKKTIESKI